MARVLSSRRSARVNVENDRTARHTAHRTVLLVLMEKPYPHGITPLRTIRPYTQRLFNEPALIQNALYLAQGAMRLCLIEGKPAGQTTTGDPEVSESSHGRVADSRRIKEPTNVFCILHHSYHWRMSVDEL